MEGLEHIVSLIETLYSPTGSARADDLNAIQQQLQSIQKSSDGTSLANALLSSEAVSDNVKYFGALTLTVRINMLTSDSESDPMFLWGLLKWNLIHLANLTQRYLENNLSKSSLVIIKKLMSNLSLIFIDINSKKPNEIREDAPVTHWNNPVNSLIVMLAFSGQRWNQINADDLSVNGMLIEMLNKEIAYTDVMNFSSLTALHNEVLLMFTEIIVEDLTKFQSKKHTMLFIHTVVHQHLYVTSIALLTENLKSLTTNKNITTVETIFNTTNAWINYASMTRAASPMDMNSVFENLIGVMVQTNETNNTYELATKILSILGNVFDNDPAMIGFELRQELECIFLGISRVAGNVDNSKYQWMLQYMNFLVTNACFTELKELSVCVVDFLQINTLDLCNKLFTTVQKLDSPQHLQQEYIKVLLQLTNFPLTPVLEESFSVKMVEFWLDLSDAFSNQPHDILLPEASNIAVEIFLQVVNIYLPKISLLNKQKIIASDEDEDDAFLHEFDDFRSAVLDLTQSLWTILGNNHLTNSLISGIGMSDASQLQGTSADYFGFYGIESMCFLLDKLLIDMTLSESSWIFNILAKNEYFVKNILLLFQTGVGIDASNKSSMTLKLDFVKSSSFLIGTLASYFVVAPQELSLCVETLFQGLQSCTISTGPHRNLHGKLETIIVKTISQLCEMCRSQLATYLFHFMDIFKTLIQPDVTVSSFGRGKMARSIGYVIEGYAGHGPDEQAKYIDQFLDLLITNIDQCLNMPPPVNVQQIDYVHSLLNCISEFGSALIHPEDSDDPQYLSKLSAFHQFWASDPLNCRAKILSVLERVLTHPGYNQNSGFIEVSCLLLGKTLTLPDDDPHFLRFSMNEITEFILSHLTISPYSTALPYFAYLLEKLVSHYKNLLTSQDFDILFQKVFLNYYDDYLCRDPDLLQAMVNFVISVLDTKPSILINSASFSNFVVPIFIKLLPSQERFTISAVTKFWTKLINNKKYTQEDSITTKRCIISVGQDVVSQTFYGLYHTQRSDLNSYTDMIRALVAKFPLETKQWLIAVLPQLCDKPQTHEAFINKLFVTRGSRAAGNVILTWWLECQSLPSY
ncbi:Kap122p KNAG_0D03340 [Huiozyma naganishii CBS 8797]|uniref:Importin N-terminal domain-containing protein n=1 Tax=Huiozyma naganishii (strain ATCC MYA-139 / BCRC 22969 / CBS 8797 / KCTC 17520 / NBRC 10181 / NCYC 3082 / Yp74L-3) TaxID=1071383 RepID=J7R5G2_HUIN7|nr:hypothetical protein KNAG_0D03340 [Kazachstania naganishii CBS 8797]CCK70080.1 hypothetical protein KNAG_0D03340 [Kazachstania naganishii CBS 8797]